MRNIYIILFSLLLIIFTGCKPGLITEQTHKNFDYQVVTADNDYQISMAELYQLLYNSKILRNGGVLDTAQVNHFLDSIMVDSLMMFELNELDITEHYHSYRVYKIQYYKSLIDAYLKINVYDQVKADSVEAVAFYNSRPDLFSLDEMVNIYHIRVTEASLTLGSDSIKYKNMSDDELQEELIRFVNNIRKEINSPSDFLEAAKKYSEDEVEARSGGHMGWIKRNVYDHPFDSIAFELRQGDIADPYLDRSGWQFLYCDGYYPQGIPEITEEFYKEALDVYKVTQSNAIGNNLFDSLFKDIDILFNDSLMDMDLYQVDKDSWMAIVNGIDTITVNESRGLALKYREQFKIQKTTAQMKEELIKRLSTRYVLKQNALSNKIDTLPEIMDLEFKIRQNNLKQVLTKKRYDPDWKASDSLLDNYYYEHLGEFEVDKPLVIQQIIVEDSLFGEFLREQAQSGYDFLDLAEEHYPGEKAIRRELADLGPVGPNDIPENLYKHALFIQAGEISYPIKTEFGYHIVKMIEKRKSLDAVSARFKINPILKRAHRREVFKDYRDYLFEKYHVDKSGSIYPIHLKPLRLRME